MRRHRLDDRTVARDVCARDAGQLTVAATQRRHQLIDPVSETVEEWLELSHGPGSCGRGITHPRRRARCRPWHPGRLAATGAEPIALALARDCHLPRCRDRPGPPAISRG